MKIELRATSHMIHNSKIYKIVEFHDGAISVIIVTIFRTSHTDYKSKTSKEKNCETGPKCLLCL